MVECVCVCVFLESHSIWQCKITGLTNDFIFLLGKIKKKKSARIHAPSIFYSFSTHRALLSGISDYSTWTRKKKKKEWAVAEEKKISLITLVLFAHLPENDSKYFSIKRNVGIIFLVPS